MKKPKSEPKPVCLPTTALIFDSGSIIHIFYNLTSYLVSGLVSDNRSTLLVRTSSVSKQVDYVMP